MAASHPGPPVPAVARQSSLGAGAAPSSPDLRTADQQAGGAVEGMWSVVRHELVVV